MAGRVTMEFQHLWLAVSLFIFIVFLLSQTNVFRQALSETVTSWKSRILFAAVFSMIGILGTYWGIRTDDGIINSRSVGVIVGGIIGGPFVGLCVASSQGFIGCSSGYLHSHGQRDNYHSAGDCGGSAVVLY